MMILFIILSLSPVKDFRYAKGLFDDGLYDLAEVELTGFLEQYPNSIYSPEASVLLLKSLNFQENFKRTIQRSNEFMRKYPQRKEDIQLLWGIAELGMENYGNAIKIFNRLSDVDKRRLWIGEVFFKQGNFKEALKYYLKSNLPYSKLSAGWCYMKMGNYDKAASIFANLFGEYEEEGKFLYARALYLKGDEKTIGAFSSYLKEFPLGEYRGRVYALLADIYEKSDDSKTAIYYLNSIIKEDPALVGFALYKIGLIYYEKDNYDLAIESFSKVKEDDPYRWDALYWMALSLSKKGMIEDAVSHLKEIITNSRELSNEALFELGSLYERMGDEEKALSLLEKVGGESRDEARIVIGNIFLKGGRYNEASSLFMKVVEEGKDNISLALLQAAVAEKGGGNEEKALSFLDSYEQRFPNGEQIYRVQLLRGDIYLNQKRYTDAIREYNKIGEEEAKNLIPNVLEGKAWAYVGLKKYNLAFITLDRLSNEFPDFCSRPEVYLQLGNAAYAMGNLSEAEKAYLQVKGPFRPRALYFLGTMFFENEKYNEAIKAFNELRNQFSLSEYSSLAAYYIAFSLRKKQDLMASNKQLYSLISMVLDKEVMYNSFLLLGDNYFDRAEYDSSLKYYKRGFDLLYGKTALEESKLDKLSAIRGILLSVNATSGTGAMENKARDFIRKFKGTGLEAKINLLVGNILYNTGQYDRALDYLEESDSPSSFYNAGIAYLKLGRRQEAIQFLKKAASSKETADRAYLELGRIAFNEGDSRKAKEYLSRSALPMASLLYALSLHKEGNRGEAMRKLEGLTGKVEGLSYLELARIQIDLGMYERALNGLKEATNYERAAPEAYYLMGELLHEQGEKDEAFKSLLKVKYLYPESKWVSPSLFLISEITLERGDRDRAINYLREIVKRGEKDWAVKARKKISEIK